MKVLVTGANGQLGCCVQDVFCSSSHSVIALSRESLDISSEESVAAAFEKHKPDVVLNTAAFTAVDKAESDPDHAAQVNAVAPGILAKAAKCAGAKLIHISTDYVFDGESSTPYRELDPANPQGVYGRSKLEGELAVQRYCDAFVILRTAWVFSEYGNNFLKTMVRVGAQRNELSVVEDQIGCPTYAVDIAKACLAIIDTFSSGKGKYGIYHYVGDEAVSWFGFASAIFSEAKQQGVLSELPNVKAIASVDYPTPAKRPAYSVMDTTNIAKDFGIAPSNWRKGVERVVGMLAQ